MSHPVEPDLPELTGAATALWLSVGDNAPCPVVRDDGNVWRAKAKCGLDLCDVEPGSAIATEQEQRVVGAGELGGDRARQAPAHDAACAARKPVRRMPVKQGHVCPPADIAAVQEKGDVAVQKGLDLAADPDRGHRATILVTPVIPLFDQAVVLGPYLGQPAAVRPSIPAPCVCTHLLKDGAWTADDANVGDDRAVDLGWIDVHPDDLGVF